MRRRDAAISLGFTVCLTLVMAVVAVAAALAGEWVFAAIAAVLAIPYRRPSELKRLAREVLGR